MHAIQNLNQRCQGMTGAVYAPAPNLPDMIAIARGALDRSDLKFTKRA